MTRVTGPLPREYTRVNGSFGLTTLLDRHVEVSGSSLRFEFQGKSGKVHRVEMSDRRPARIVQWCQALPGQDLFQYLDDDGTRQTIGSEDVNNYLREISGEEFTAKDFRTWAGTILAVGALTEAGEWMFGPVLPARCSVIFRMERMVRRSRR